MSDLKDRIAALPPEKKALLEERLRAGRPAGAPEGGAGTLLGDRVELVAIPRDQVRRRRSEIQRGPGGKASTIDSDEEVYVFPPSFDQERLLFVELYEPGSTYNVPMPIPFPGPVDVAALRAAFQHLVNRHETLRTTFGFLDQKPVQVVSIRSNIELEVTDLSELPEPDKASKTEEISRAHAREPFDLLRGPLLRAHLLRLAEDNHLLLFNMHHIISDLWSITVLTSEFSQLYLDLAQGRTPDLPELPVQYGDYAVWQRKLLDGEVIEDVMKYWRKQLQGAPQKLALPIDRPRPRVQTVNGADWLFPLGEDLSRRLKTLCQQEKMTIFPGTVAALGVLLGHYAGVDDLLIGTPMSNRARPGLEGLIGIFLNTVILRVRPRPAISFRELLRQVQATFLDAFEHQDMPLGILIEELLEQRSLNYSPLFQVMIAHMHDAMSTRPMEVNLPAEIGEGMPVSGGTGTAKFDLVLSVMESERGVLGTWEYNVDLFDPSTITRLGRRYRQLAEAVVENPDRSINSLNRLIKRIDSQEAAAAQAEVSSVEEAAPSANASPPASPSPAPETPQPEATQNPTGPEVEHPTVGLTEVQENLQQTQIDALLGNLFEEGHERESAASSGPSRVETPQFPASPEGDPRLASPQVLLARIDDLSQNEVDELLAGMLSELGDGAEPWLADSSFSGWRETSDHSQSTQAGSEGVAALLARLEQLGDDEVDRVLETILSGREHLL